MLKLKWQKTPDRDGIDSQAFNNVRIIILADIDDAYDTNFWFTTQNRGRFIENSNDELEIIENYGYEYQLCLN